MDVTVSKLMKILLVTDSFNYCCGRSRHIATLAKYLRIAGHEVSVLCGGGDGQSLLDGLGVNFIKSALILHQNRSYTRFILGILKILALLYKHHYDIIHAHHHYASMMSRPASILFGVPHVMTIHGAVKKQGLLSFYSGNYFIAVSHATKLFAIQEKKSLSHRITSISNGIDLSHSEQNSSIQDIRQIHEIGKNDFIISMIGRIVPHKGHEVLIKSIAELKSTENICVLIVGAGDYLTDLRKMVLAYNIRVIFTEVVREPTHYYRQSDIIVIPSLCCEGLPMTLLEAGKYSKAVIASRIDGIAEVIVHNKNGCLVEPNDVMGLKNALLLLIGSRELRESFGEELNKSVRNLYSAQRMTDETIRVYSQLTAYEVPQ